MGHQLRLLLMGLEWEGAAGHRLIPLDTDQEMHQSKPREGQAKEGETLLTHKEVVDRGAQEVAHPIHHRQPQDRGWMPRLHGNSLSLRRIYTPTPPRSRCNTTC